MPRARQVFRRAFRSDFAGAADPVFSHRGTRQPRRAGPAAHRRQRELRQRFGGDRAAMRGGRRPHWRHAMAAAREAEIERFNQLVEHHVASEQGARQTPPAPGIHRPPADRPHGAGRSTAASSWSMRWRRPTSRRPPTSSSAHRRTTSCPTRRPQSRPVGARPHSARQDDRRRGTRLQPPTGVCTWLTSHKPVHISTDAAAVELARHHRAQAGRTRTGAARALSTS